VVNIVSSITLFFIGSAVYATADVVGKIQRDYPLAWAKRSRQLTFALGVMLVQLAVWAIDWLLVLLSVSLPEWLAWPAALFAFAVVIPLAYVAVVWGRVKKSGPGRAPQSPEPESSRNP
jgi:hypothetical protein